MDIVKELRIYRLAFRLVSEKLALVLKEDAERLQTEMLETARRLEEAAGRDVA